MNYRYVKAISGIGNTPFVYQGDVFFFTKDSQLCKADKELHPLWQTPVDAMWLGYQWNDHIYPYKPFEHTYVISAETGTIEQKLFTNFSPALSEIGVEFNIRAGISRLADGRTQFATLDLATQQVRTYQESYNRLPSFYVNSLFFYTKESEEHTLICYSAKDNSVFWRLHIPGTNISAEEQYFGRDFYCYENVLIAQIGRAGYIGIDVNSGQLLWENYIVYASKLSNGKLYSVGGEHFRVVDAITGKTEISLNLTTHFDSFKIYAIGRFTITDHFIYFKDGRGKLGIFSTQERRIVWHHDLNTTGKNVKFGALDAPVIAGDKLMMLDLNSDLHIFQRAD